MAAASHSLSQFIFTSFSIHFQFIHPFVRQVKVPTTASGDGDAVEVKVTVAQLPTTKAIDNMIQNGQVQTSVNGLTIQNGLTTNLVSAKTATGKDRQITDKDF